MKSPEKITLIPKGGLPERLRSVAGTIALARRYQRPLEIIWFANEELYCPSYRLFTLNPLLSDEGITIREARAKDWFVSDRPHLSNAYCSLPFILLKYDHYLSPRNIRQIIAQGSNAIDERFASNERMLLITDCGIGDYKGMYEIIEPTFEAMNAYLSKTSGWNDNVVGIRLHREWVSGTYHQMGETPTELFIRRMQRMIEDDSNVHFFIASDFAEERERLATIFGDRVHVPYSLSSRNTHEGCINAFAEILALSQTRLILSTKNSPFAQVAAFMGGVTYETISIYKQS